MFFSNIVTVMESFFILFNRSRNRKGKIKKHIENHKAQNASIF